MKDRTEILFPIKGADGPVIQIHPWVPPKTLVEEFKGFKIFRSATSESPSNIIQLAIVHTTIQGDMLRVDSYDKGYFAARWLSAVKLPEFLNATEGYFQEFEDQFTGETHGIMGSFTSWREPEFYEFSRPITMEDLGREKVFIGDDQHTMGLLRLETLPGDIIYEPKDQSVGIITYLDQSKEQPTIDAVARLVTRTQALLPEDVVARIIELLPYRRIPSEN